MHFRRPLLFLLSASLVFGLRSVVVAQAPDLPSTPPLRERNAWDQFGIGSWKLVRVYTETLGEGGEVESVKIADMKTTLDGADEGGYTLKVEATYEIAGKRIPDKPKFVTYGAHGELLGQAVEVKELGSGQTEICNQKYVTGSRRIVISSDTTQSISTVEYSNTVAPYFLKRTTESFLKRTTELLDNETNPPDYHSVVEVIAVEMPEKVLTEIKSAAHVKTVETFSNGNKIVTLEVHCDSVPGGVVSHTSKTLSFDKTLGVDKIVTHSTLELIDYEAISKVPGEKEPTTASRYRLFQGRRRK